MVQSNLFCRDAVKYFFLSFFFEFFLFFFYFFPFGSDCVAASSTNQGCVGFQNLGPYISGCGSCNSDNIPDATISFFWVHCFTTVLFCFCGPSETPRWLPLPVEQLRGLFCKVTLRSSGPLTEECGRQPTEHPRIAWDRCALGACPRPAACFMFVHWRIGRRYEPQQTYFPCKIMNNLF